MTKEDITEIFPDFDEAVRSLEMILVALKLNSSQISARIMMAYRAHGEKAFNNLDLVSMKMRLDYAMETARLKKEKIRPNGYLGNEICAIRILNKIHNKQKCEVDDKRETEDITRWDPYSEQ